MRARYLHRATGKFTTEDPVWGKNLYVYALNNTVQYMDPSGEIVPLLIVGYVLFEMALTAYDAYDTYKTLNDPNASDLEKSISLAGFMAGLEAPGGGYGVISKGIIKNGDKIVSKVAIEGIEEIATKTGLANSRALGIAGEQAVGVGSKVRIESLTGTASYRIPDILTKTTLGEVKNVSHLSLTRQLTDFHLYSQQNGLQFILHTRPTTTFSGPLQNLINKGSIIVKPIPFK